MKAKTLLFGFLILYICTASLNAQTDYFYYYDGKKQYLELDTKYIFVSVTDKNATNISVQNTKQKPLRVDITDKMPLKSNRKRFWTELSIEENLSDSLYLSKLSEIRNSRKDVIVSPYFKNKYQDKIGLSNFLYVKLKSLNDTIILKQEADKENAIIVLQNEFMPLWFVVSITEKSKYNAMEMANRFYESELFQYAGPDLMVDDQVNCVNDTHFGQQWGLRNTGQSGGTSGIDIKVCDAWQISTGNNVTVAVLDEGIDLTHPDLAANIHPLSFDCESGTVPQIVRGNHGTACAGIIGAIRNNTAGIAGVAPNCRLMSISNSFEGTPLSRMTRADGINWAWQHGADIISNSWGSSVQYPIIDDAINNAVTQGRNGRGCVVIFASGNEYATNVAYPASLPNVIAVGAINRNGQRADFSNYGTALDVVAPGVLIPTTDIQGNAGYNYVTSNNSDPAYSDYSNKDYTGKFGGTSAACPHVAGVAALILSVRPDLTQAQVRQAIESTCTKLSEYYSFSNNSAHPNGTWHSQVGYGLVNAYAAVSSILPTITGTSSICSGSSGTYTVTNPPSSYTWSSSSNLTKTSQSGNTATFTRYGSGSAWVAVNAGGVELKRFNLVGTGYAPNHSSIPSVSVVPEYGYSNVWCAEANGMPDVNEYEWTVTLLSGSGWTPASGWSVYLHSSPSPNMPYKYKMLVNGSGSSYSPQSVIVRVRAHNTCGWSDEWNPVSLTGGGGGYYVSTYPNPVSDVLNIEINSIADTLQPLPLSKLQTSAAAPVSDVKLYNQSGTLVRSLSAADTQIQLNVSDLPAGIYYLHVGRKGKTPEIKTIIVSR